jgi:hypothetical protein
MTFRTVIIAGTLGALVAAPAAAAQDPVGGNGRVGGTVPSSLELILTQPRATFASFTKAKTYRATVDVRLTTTDPGAQLSLADGDVASGAKRGRLASGSKVLSEPLQARVGSAAFAPLDRDAWLLKLSETSTRRAAKIDLRQPVKSKAAGTYRKVVLVTLSSETP